MIGGAGNEILTIDGEPLALAAGQCWTAATSAPLAVTLPGVLTVRIDPGAAELRGRLGDARE